MSNDSWSSVNGYICGPNGNIDAGVYSAAVGLPDGTVLITGGEQRLSSGTAAFSHAWLYSNGNISLLPAAMSGQRYGHTATLLPNGKVLIVGCANQTLQTRYTAELYDPVSRTFSPTTTTPKLAHGFHTATLLQNNKVLLVGGYDGFNGMQLAAELYDYTNDTFQLTNGSLNFMKFHSTATLLNDGTVLIIGGPYPGPGGPYAETYDPNTESFFACSSPQTDRSMHAAALLPDGSVLVAGGCNGANGQQMKDEIRHPNGTWEYIDLLPGSPRYGLTLTQLLNGQVLAVGGGDASDPACTLPTNCGDSYRFDPATKNWIAIVGSFPDVKRSYHSASLIPTTGQVLLSCGFEVPRLGPGGTTSTLPYYPAGSELYWPEVVTLYLSFQGTGNGSITIDPAGITYDSNVNAQFAAGLKLQLSAHPGGSWSAVAWEKVSGTAGPHGTITLPHWARVSIYHTNTFDGWGKVAPYDMTNPKVVVMNQNHGIVVNFGDHTTTKPWPMPFFPKSS